MKHGLLAKRLIFSKDRQLVDEGLQRLFEDLHDKYGHGDVLIDVLVESVVTEYWRVAQGLKIEIDNAVKASSFDPRGGMGNVLRYGTASRRALQKNVPDNESPTPQVIVPTDGAGSAGASVSEQPEDELETSGQPEDAVPKAA